MKFVREKRLINLLGSLTMPVQLELTPYPATARKMAERGDLVKVDHAPNGEPRYMLREDLRT